MLLLEFLTTDVPSEVEGWERARMKAEWCLWDGYSKWEIGLNPFLGHFVEIWEGRYGAGRVSGDVLVVGIILSGQAKEVTNAPLNLVACLLVLV